MTEIVSWDAVAAQRAILADLLDRFEPGQWDQPSPCRAWRVRHVVAHMIGEATASKLGTAAGLVRHGFRLDAFIPPMRCGAANTARPNWLARTAASRCRLTGFRVQGI